MKKEYVNPTMTIVEIASETVLLQESNTFGSKDIMNEPADFDWFN